MAETEECGGCEFFDLPEEKDLGRKPDDYDEFACRRYPKTERKRLCDWCGEFRAREPEPEEEAEADDIAMCPTCTTLTVDGELCEACQSKYKADHRTLSSIEQQAYDELARLIVAQRESEPIRQAAKENRGTTIDDIVKIGDPIDTFLGPGVVVDSSEHDAVIRVDIRTPQPQAVVRAETIARRAELILPTPIVPLDVLRSAAVGEKVDTTNSYPGEISARNKDGSVDVLFRDFDVTFRYRVP
jgi:hypothetical protein